MPERAGLRKEQCCSHASARDGDVGLHSHLAIAQSRILHPSDCPQNVPALFALTPPPSCISACGEPFPACPCAAPCSAQALSHTQPLTTPHFPSSSAPQSWSKCVQEPSSALPVLRHTVKGLGHCCTRTLGLHCV